MPKSFWFYLACFYAAFSPLSTHAQAFVRRSDRILRIELATGAQSTLFTPTGQEAIGDLIVLSNDALLAVVYTRTNPGEEEPRFRSRIISINVSNALATEVFSDDAERAETLSITTAPDGNIYAAAAGNILQIDSEDGSAVTLATEPVLESIWGILSEPSGTLLLGVFESLQRFDPLTGNIEYVADFDPEITWVNSFVTAPDGTIYLAGDNEKLVELTPSGQLRVVTAGGYMGNDDSSWPVRNSAIAGLAWLNSTQLIATVTHQVNNWFFSGPYQSEARLIWIDIITGEQHLISENDWLRPLSPQPSFSGLALLGTTPPRTAAPRLEIRLASAPGSFSSLHWSAPNYVLQFSTNIGTANRWFNVPFAPVAFSGKAGFRFSATNAQHYYRLDYIR